MVFLELYAGDIFLESQFIKSETRTPKTQKTLVDKNFGISKLNVFTRKRMMKSEGSKHVDSIRKSFVMYCYLGYLV